MRFVESISSQRNMMQRFDETFSFSSAESSGHFRIQMVQFLGGKMLQVNILASPTDVKIPFWTHLRAGAVESMYRSKRYAKCYHGLPTYLFPPGPDLNVTWIDF